MRTRECFALIVILLLMSGCFSSSSTTDVTKVADRYNPDIAIPISPPCPDGSDCAEVNVCSESHSQIQVDYNSEWILNGTNRMMSSPRVANLNGDATLDIIVGAGVEETEKGSIIAIDGETGVQLWEINTTGEMFASAQFSDLTGDNIVDVVLGGRGTQLLAVNGLTGDVIWKFNVSSPERSTWYQFYTGQFIEDQNNDGFQDWLTSNGGDPLKLAHEERQNGYMMILSGKTGEVLGVADTPDNRETYMSPLVFKPHPEMDTEVLFGTGGETWPGGLWVTTLDDILSGDISNSTQIISPEMNVSKGIMAPPAIADLTLDGIKDIIAATFDGRIIAIDGRNYTHIWTIDVKEYALGTGVESAESWASPAVGYFTDDAVPDVASIYLVGTWPQYQDVTSLLIDGATGELITVNDTNHFSSTSPLAVDFDGDGRDEIVLIRNGIKSSNGTTQMYNSGTILDTCTLQETELFNKSDISIGTPIIVDLDSDGDLEIITTTTTYYGSTTEMWTVERMDLSSKNPDKITWGAYMGTNYDGELIN